LRLERECTVETERTAVYAWTVGVHTEEIGLGQTLPGAFLSKNRGRAVRVRQMPRPVDEKEWAISDTDVTRIRERLCQPASMVQIVLRGIDLLNQDVSFVAKPTT
jgi:hypothetical protein